MVSENHAYGEWVTKKQGTCTEAGLREHICRLCGKVEPKDIPAAHIWEVTEEGSIKYTLDKKNGCTTEGMESQHCRICSATQNERTLPATGHSFGEWIETVSECTGIVKTRICENCGTVETENAAGNHTWESQATIDKEATCTEDGNKSIHCSKCSVTKDMEIIPAMGHKLGEAWLHQATEHWHICNVCEMILDKADHMESDWIIEKEASETEAGTKKKICTVCGRELRWGLIPAGGSEASGSIVKEVEVKEKAPVKEVSVGQDISKLQETVLSEKERKAVLEEGTDIEIVVEVARVASDKEPDSAQLKKIIEKAVGEIKDAASLCDEELSGEPGLVYMDLSMHKKITAIRKETDPESGTVTTSTEKTVEDVHKVKEAITITLGIPEDIRYPKSEAYLRKFTVVRVHESGAGTEIEALPTQEKDGKLTFETDRFSIYAIIYQDVAACAGGNHTWDENYTVDKKATCTEVGSKSVHCRYCSEVKDVQAIPAIGHEYGDWKVVKEATKMTSGEREKYCTTCGNVVKETISAIKKEKKDKPATGDNGQAANSNMERKLVNTATRKSQDEEAPETGDESRPFLYALLAVLSGLGIGFIGRKKKKEKNV